MLVEEKKPDDVEEFPVKVPHELRMRFREAIKGVYQHESEAVRDLMRKFAESRGC